MWPLRSRSSSDMAVSLVASAVSPDGSARGARLRRPRGRRPVPGTSSAPTAATVSSSAGGHGHLPAVGEARRSSVPPVGSPGVVADHGGRDDACAGVGLVDLESHLDRGGVDRGLGLRGVAAAEATRWWGRAVEPERVLGDEPPEPGGRVRVRRRTPPPQDARSPWRWRGSCSCCPGPRSRAARRSRSARVDRRWRCPSASAASSTADGKHE